jgi:hypothetical protein
MMGLDPEDGWGEDEILAVVEESAGRVGDRAVDRRRADSGTDSA